MGDWSDDELTAAVNAYAAMMDMHRRGEKFNKAAIYRELASQFDRAPEAFERRMMNISAMLEANAKQWLPGLAPARNIGSGVEPRLAAALVRAGVLTKDRSEDPGPLAAWPMPFPTASQRRANLRKLSEGRTATTTRMTPPAGVLRPKEIAPTTKTFARDEAVKAWVLQRAGGVCECCHQPAPFEDVNGEPFLEVHHLKQLAQGGSDRHSNAVAVCPNCHRELHHGRKAEALRSKLLSEVPELKAEGY